MYPHNTRHGRCSRACTMRRRSNRRPSNQERMCICQNDKPHGRCSPVRTMLVQTRYEGRNRLQHRRSPQRNRKSRSRKVRGRYKRWGTAQAQSNRHPRNRARTRIAHLRTRHDPSSPLGTPSSRSARSNRSRHSLHRMCTRRVRTRRAHSSATDSPRARSQRSNQGHPIQQRRSNGPRGKGHAPSSRWGMAHEWSNRGRQNPARIRTCAQCKHRAPYNPQDIA